MQSVKGVQFFSLDQPFGLYLVVLCDLWLCFVFIFVLI